MKTMLILLVLLMAMALQGCSTVRGLGQFMSGVGDDTIGLSNAIKNEVGKGK